MSKECCSVPAAASQDEDPAFQRVLWVALAVNAAMFAAEVAGSVASGSVSLLADAVDFFGDAANYGLSLSVLSLGLAWRARAALVKGLTMGAFGLFVLMRAGWSAFQGIVPEPFTMGAIAVVALAANVGVAVMLFRSRGGDANRRSVWLCTRNDAIGNLAVMLAALGVLGTGSTWPDVMVAAIMAGLALTASVSVIRHALREIGYAQAPSAG